MDAPEKFEGWAIVELLGHARELGWVTTKYFGNQAMFQVDTPAIPEREVTIFDGCYFENKWLGNGSIVIKTAIPAKQRIVSSAAIYAINPSTEQEILADVGGEGPILRVVKMMEAGEEIPF